MPIIKLTTFGGLRPKASARALPDDAAQTANNLLATTTEFRPLAADSTIVAASGVSNPQTIYRMQRLSGGALNLDFASAANWSISAIEKSFVKGQLNDDATERTYVTFNDASQPARAIDNTGQDRQLGVPAPTTAPTVAVNVVDEFTPEERSSGIDAGIAQSVQAIRDNVTPVWLGAAHPGTAVTGVLDRSADNGFAAPNTFHEARLYRLTAAGGTVNNSYCSVDASQFSWIFDPLLAGFPFTALASPSWAGGAGTAHLAIAYCAYGLTYALNSAGLTTELAAIPMPGKTDGTKLWTGAQVTQVVSILGTVLDPAGPEVGPTIALLASKVAELRVLLDGGGLASVVATTQAFYSKSDVATEISTAINNFANNVFQQADLVARSSLPADNIVSGDSGQ